MFQLWEEGYHTIFEQLVSCIISIRTMDEMTMKISHRLFAKARTPQQVLDLEDQELIDLLYGSQYPGQKLATIKAVAQAALDHGGDLPANYEVLTSLKGVGPKCANLALGVAAGQQAISVDIHVHRVVNRWGVIATTNPEKTMLELETWVPNTHWRDVNRLLMPFGKFICTGVLPHCSICPVYAECSRVGVLKHR
jgi:endonuclease-3